jgi:drug/metabolite transporter (DMT)-like permease
VTLLPLAWLHGDAIWPHRWWPLAALAIGSQVLGQGLLVYVIGALPPTVVGIGLLTQPAIAATIGWLVYGERLTPGDLIGAAAIAAALILIRRRG